MVLDAWTELRAWKKLFQKGFGSWVMHVCSRAEEDAKKPPPEFVQQTSLQVTSVRPV